MTSVFCDKRGVGYNSYTYDEKAKEFLAKHGLKELAKPDLTKNGVFFRATINVDEIDINASRNNQARILDDGRLDEGHVTCLQQQIENKEAKLPAIIVRYWPDGNPQKPYIIMDGNHRSAIIEESRGKTKEKSEVRFVNVWIVVHNDPKTLLYISRTFNYENGKNIDISGRIQAAIQDIKDGRFTQAEAAKEHCLNNGTLSAKMGALAAREELEAEGIHCPRDISDEKLTSLYRLSRKVDKDLTLEVAKVCLKNNNIQGNHFRDLCKNLGDIRNNEERQKFWHAQKSKIEIKTSHKKDNKRIKLADKLDKAYKHGATFLKMIKAQSVKNTEPVMAQKMKELAQAQAVAWREYFTN
jgi:hypothetical protein